MATSQIAVQQLRRSFAIAKKDLLVYYSKGPVVIFGILMPGFLLLAFAIGRQMPMAFLMPGMLGVTVFFTATAVSPVVAPTETQMRTLERLASCPVSVSTILFGDVIASFLFGIVISIVPIVIGLAAGVTIVHPFVLALGIILAALCFSTMALLFSFPATSSPATIMMISSLVKFPLVFLSGVFIPLNELPSWGKAIALLSPLTYFTDLARYCIGGTSLYSVPLNLLILLAFTIVFAVVSWKLHQMTLPRRL